MDPYRTPPRGAPGGSLLPNVRRSDDPINPADPDFSPLGAGVPLHAAEPDYTAGRSSDHANYNYSFSAGSDGVDDSYAQNLFAASRDADSGDMAAFEVDGSAAADVGSGGERGHGRRASIEDEYHHRAFSPTPGGLRAGALTFAAAVACSPLPPHLMALLDKSV